MKHPIMAEIELHLLLKFKLKSFEILFLLFDSLDKNFSQITSMRLVKKVQS